MSRGRGIARDDVGMNLFPFLAVLICTMGSLIVLLVVMVQQARVRARTSNAATEQVAASDAPTVDEGAPRRARREERRRLARERQQQIEDFQWQASLLRTSYEQATEQLAERRLALSHLEAHTRKLSEQAGALRAEAQAITRATANEIEDANSAAAEVERLRDQRAKALEELERTREAIQSRKQTYALVPYEGPSGTQRRPLYIECTADHVILQPEGVILRGEDFEEPLGPGNPLASALRAKREFLLENGLLGKDDEPYPLLVVRPRAAAAYAACRMAMTAWEAEFGYELIEADVKLDYPQPDPRLTRILQEVVEDVRDRRRLVRAVRDTQSHGVPQGALRISSRGGFEPVRTGRSGGSDRYHPGPHDAEHGESFGSGRGGDTSGSFARGRGDVPTDGFPTEAEARRGDSADEPTQGPGGLGRGSGDAFELRSAGSEARGFTRANGPGSTTGDGAVGGHHGGRPYQPDGNGAATADDATADASDRDDLRGGLTGPGNDLATSGAGGANPDGSSARGEPTGQSSGGAGGSSGPNAGRTSASLSSFGAPGDMPRPRGANWALPHLTANSVGVRRPITIVCGPRQLVLPPERGAKQQVRTFRHDGNVTAVIDPVATAIRQRIESWGIPGRGIHWQPVLQVQVRQGGMENYRHLERLLENSGIQVTRQP